MRASLQPPLRLLATALVLAVVTRADGAEANADFEKKIRPVLQDHCFKCHNPDKKKGGIDLTEFTDEGSVLKKYKLWQRVVEQIETEQMPPDDDKFTPFHGSMVISGVKQTLALLDSGHPSLLDPGPSLVRRLSRVEYHHALRDLTGLDLDFAQLVGMQEDSTGSSFENVAAALTVQPALLEKYFAATDIALAGLFGESDAQLAAKPDWERKKIAEKFKQAREKFFVGLPESADRASTQEFVGRFARLAWRRPLVNGEVDRLLKIYDVALAGGDQPRAALRKTLKPILVSSGFLFRIEEDRTPKAPATGTAVAAARVTDMELASRLSFFLWSSIPDDELLVAAERNQLSQPPVLEAQVKRMLADPRAKALTENFFIRWLGANKIAQARPSTEFFPTFNDRTKKGLLAEVTAFCDNLRTEDRRVLELLDADYTFVDSHVAKHYGLSVNVGEAPVRVALKPEDHRGGVLGMGAILAATSHTNRTSPTQRGKWVLDVIFGTPPSPPPANASQFKDEDKRKKEPKDFREKLAQHASDATCAGCHRKMDPLGFGLDNFDAVGGWRPTSPDLDTSGVLPSGEKFDGADGLKKIIWARRDQFARNVIGQMLSYAVGRELDYFDEGQITRIKAAMDQGGNKFSTLVLGLVNSYPFQYRRNADPQPDANPKTAAAN